MYSITRVIPSISTLRTMTEEQTILPTNLVLLYNYFDTLKSPKIIPADMQKKELKDEMELIQERVDELVQSLKAQAYSGIQQQLLYNKLICSEDFDSFKQNLDEFEEDLDYEEIKMHFLQGINDKNMHQLIVELVKQEILTELKRLLGELIEDEITKIYANPELDDEQKDK